MGSIGLNNQIFLGSTIVIFSRFDPSEYLNAIERYKATYLTGAPQLYRPLVYHPDLHRHDVSSIKLAASGAAPLPHSLLQKMLDAFPGVVLESYGLTECTQCVSLMPPVRQGIRFGSVGIPLFDTEIRFVDPETAEPLSPGQEGEICVKGPQVMKGYWRRPDETAVTLREGWLFTGDIGREDEDGYLYITDRKKDMIIYKGHNIYPRELEEIIFRHPAVELCAVVGKLDPVGGEIPIAFVQLKKRVEANSLEILEFVNQQVSYYKKVREVIITDQIPVSGPGKVLKRVLKDRLR
jgi:long-chain acyl-CoA synthetase